MWGVWVAALGGLLVGGGARILLGSLRRGARVPLGILELVTATTCAVSWALVGPGPAVALPLWLAVLAPAVAAVDLRHHRIPDAVTAPAAAVTAVVVAVVSVTAPGTLSPLRAFIAAVALSAVLAGLAVVAGMGWGDVKLMPTLAGACGAVGWQPVLLMWMLAAVAAGLVAAGGMLLGRWNRHSHIAFGPFLAGGAWVALLIGSVG